MKKRFISLEELTSANIEEINSDEEEIGKIEINLEKKQLEFWNAELDD